MPPSSFIPTRLLDVAEHDLKLVETSELDKSEGHKWCALSYVWGADVLLKTTKATQFAHKECIPLDSLPKTLKDAVSVCRGMGFRYLWIDALCIIQDDQEDLREELSHMPEVYQYAGLTICAASSTSIHDGFLYQRGYWSHMLPATTIRIATDSGDSISLFVYLFLCTLAFIRRPEPISRRAWTYQEDMLSPRMLNYRTHHLEWKCKTHAELVGAPRFDFFKTSTNKFDRSEKEQDGGLMTTPGTYRLSSLITWREVIVEYSHRKASLATDRLRALSAIARAYHLETGKEYLAGLWKEDVPGALCWANGFIPLSEEDRIYGLLTSQRPKEYRAPSWSWASLETPVHFWGSYESYTPEARVIQGVQVLDAGITATYPGGEFDSIASGFLVLQAPVWVLELPTPAKMHEFRVEDPTTRHSYMECDDLCARVWPDTIEDSQEMVDTLWFLLLAEIENDYGPGLNGESHTTYCGLVLKEAKGFADTCSRIGYFKTWPLPCELLNKTFFTPAMFLDLFEDRTITLI